MRNFFRLLLPVIIIGVSVLVCVVGIAREHITKDIAVVFDSALQGCNRRPRVAFRHDAHNEIAAFEYAACHHVYEDGRLVENATSEDKECSECHAGKDDPGRLNLVAAYHNLCKGCHEEEKKGPVMCGECHKKQERS